MSLFVPNSLATMEICGGEHPCGVPVIRQSVLKDWKTCIRLFFYRHVLGLSPKRPEKAYAANIGTFAHAINASMYTTKGDWEASLKAGKEEYKSKMTELESHLDNDLSGEIASMIGATDDAWSKAKVICRIFWDRHPFDPDIQVVWAEDPIAIELDGSLIVQAKPDLVVRSQGGLWIFDHKTTTKDPSDLLLGRPWHYQTALYTAVVEEKFEEEVLGFLYNVLAVPTIKCCGKDEKAAKKKGCTPFEAYMERVSQWYDDYKTNPFVTNWVPNTTGIADDLLRIECEVCAGTATDGISNYGENGPHDKCSLEACFARDYTGNACYRFFKKCPFHGLCETQPASWPQQIEMTFDQAFPVLGEQVEPEEEEEAFDG